MKKVDVLTEITIDAPLKKVAAYVSNPDHAPEWYVNIKASEWKTNKPLRVGSQIAFKARFMGKHLSYIYEVAEYVEDQQMVMQTADGPFPMQTTYTWKALSDNRTQMTLRNAGTPAGFSKVFAPLMVSAMKKANRKDLQLLKQILERR